MTSTTYPYDSPSYGSPTTTTDPGQSFRIQEAQNALDSAQSRLTSDENAYQSAQSDAASKAGYCNTDQAAVQRDLSEGYDPSADDAAAQRDCGNAETAAEAVSGDASQVQSDQTAVSQTEDQLQRAEQGY